MNAFTYIPPVAEPEPAPTKERPAVEWQRPVINSVTEALDEASGKLDRLLALLRVNTNNMVETILRLDHSARTPLFVHHRLFELATESLTEIDTLVSEIGCKAFGDVQRRYAGAYSLSNAAERAAWSEALAEYIAIEAKPTEGMTDEELEADGNAASTALLGLLDMRCPDLPALAEKLDVIAKTDAMMVSTTMHNLHCDVAYLAGMPEPKLPALETAEAF